MDIYRALNKYAGGAESDQRPILQTVLGNPSRRLTLSEVKFLCEVSVKMYMAQQIPGAAVKQLAETVFGRDRRRDRRRDRCRDRRSPSLECWQTVMSILLGEVDREDELALSILAMSQLPAKLAAVLAPLRPIDQSLVAVLSTGLSLAIFAQGVRLPAALPPTSSVYFFNRRCKQRLEEYAESISLEEKYGAIVSDIFAQFGAGADRSHLELFTAEFFQDISKDTDFTGYFRRRLRDRLRQSPGCEDWLVEVLERFAWLVLRAGKSGKRVLRYQDAADMDWLYGYALKFLILPESRRKFSHFELLLMGYSSVSTALPLLVLQDWGCSSGHPADLGGAIEAQSEKVWEWVIRNPHLSSKSILTHYLGLSAIKLKRYPAASIVDPLHFLMVRAEFWRHPYHSRVLSAGLASMADGWVHLVRERDQCPEQERASYVHEMLLVLYQFLLCSRINCLVEYHPLESGLLPSLFLTPSFPSLAARCPVRRC